MDNQATIEFLAENDEKSLELLLQLTNRYLDQQAEISQQKKIIKLQGNLIGQCMERIMQLEGHVGIAPHDVYKIAEQLARRIETLEGRSILGDFNQRIDILENRVHALSQVIGSWEARVETLEANQGKFYGLNDRETIRMTKQLIKRVDELESWLYTHDYAYFQEQENQPGNSSFEEHEMYHPEDTTGTHPPDCRCSWCEPQERSMAE